jgi:MinD-like ATPase involved in chromosome partitioning or flagellar assembly
MSEPIRVLVAFSDETNRFELESVFDADPQLDVVAYGDELDDDWHHFFDQKSDVVVVVCDEVDARTGLLVDRAAKNRPDRPVIVAAHGSPNGSLRTAFESGRGLVQAGTPTAPLVVVLGPKGGTGKTLISANLAVALSRRDLRVVLVDLDLQFGDIGLALGLAPERTIYELAKAGAPYDHDKLERHLITHSSGVKVLVGPTRPDHASVITIDFLRDVYASLRTMCDVVIVDTPPGFTPEVIATIDVSTSAVVVGMLDSLSLKNTKLGIETLELMGYPSDNLSLVLNRADSRVGITHEDVRTIIGRAPDVFVPSDREIPRSVNEGTPIVASRERSEAAKAFQQLADRYTKKAIPAPTVAKPAEGQRSLLARRRR